MWRCDYLWLHIPLKEYDLCVWVVSLFYCLMIMDFIVLSFVSASVSLYSIYFATFRKCISCELNTWENEYHLGSYIVTKETDFSSNCPLIRDLLFSPSLSCVLPHLCSALFMHILYATITAYNIITGNNEHILWLDRYISWGQKETRTEKRGKVLHSYKSSTRIWHLYCANDITLLNVLILG